MIDKRFHDVVIESNEMIGPEGIYNTAICSKCSQQHKVSTDDFEMDNLYKVISAEDGHELEPANALDAEEETREVLRYVAEMRAWNCCHEDLAPLDGFPSEPDASRVNFGT